MTMLLFYFVHLLMVCSEGTRVWDQQNFISWDKGNGRIIITAPHGGSLKPTFIPDRSTLGCVLENDNCNWTVTCQPKNQSKCNANLNQDVNTIPIAHKLYETLTSMGLSPHLIVSHVHRAKVDVNRPIDEATQGNPHAKSAYNAFHEFVESAKKTIRGPGLYFDLHGQGHRENWTEIGYRISTEKLINGKYSALNSSIRSLALRSNMSNPNDLIIGTNSFGAILEQIGVGYKVTPGAKIPKPNLGGYYQGGYNTLVYGSLNGGQIDGIQVEITSDIRLRSVQVYEQFAIDLAQAIDKFMKIHDYGLTTIE